RPPFPPANPPTSKNIRHPSVDGHLELASGALHSGPRPPQSLAHVDIPTRTVHKHVCHGLPHQSKSLFSVVLSAYGFSFFCSLLSCLDVSLSVRSLMNDNIGTWLYVY